LEEKTVVILGATGSIGTQTVDVIGKIPGFKIVGISFGKNGTVAQGILNKFQVRYYLGDFELDNGTRVECTKRANLRRLCQTSLLVLYLVLME